MLPHCDAALRGARLRPGAGLPRGRGGLRIANGACRLLLLQSADDHFIKYDKLINGGGFAEFHVHEFQYEPEDLRGTYRLEE